MAIAKELGYAETAFISASEMADYKLEYFTPKEEVDLCGHATIGAFTILMHLNKLFKDRYTIETNSGVLTITIKMTSFSWNKTNRYSMILFLQTTLSIVLTLKI